MIAWLGLMANGLLLSGAWWLAGSAFRQTRILDRVLASSVLGVTWCLLGIEILGSLGLLTIGPLTIWMGLLCAVGLIAHWRRPTSDDRGRNRHPERLSRNRGAGKVFWLGHSCSG